MEIVIMFDQFDFNDENIYRLIDLAKINIYWKDKDGRYLGCNKSVLEMIGIDNRDEIIGKTDYCFFVKNEADKFVAIDKSVIQGNPYYGEESGTLANGEFRVYLTTKVPMLNENGDVIGLMGTSTDITQFKTKMEVEKHQAVLNEEIKLKQIIDLVDANIYWEDTNGAILGCNQQVLKIFNYSSQEGIIGKTAYDLFTLKEEADKIRAIDNIVFETGSYRGEEAFTDVNGKQKVYLSVKNKLFNNEGNIIGLVGTSIDITAQKEAEQLKLENLELEKQQIIDSVDANIYWKDTNGTTLGCNKYVLNMFGFSGRDEIIGRNDYEYLSKSEADKIKAVDQLVIKTGSYRGEEYTTVNGKRITYFSAKNRLIDSRGNIIGIVGASLDITAQKEAERLKLENEAHKLENESKTRLLEQESQFRQFIGQIVHDIQSPLSSLNVIINETSSSIPEEKRITLRQAAMRISDIAQHMQSRYKNEEDEHELALPVLVSASILEVLSEKRYEHKAVNFETDFKACAQFAFIRIEQSQFTRMISNLINNAVEALDNKLDAKVGLRLNSNEEWVMITISDNGKGMPPELVDKIRNNIAVTQGKKRGSGIGLTQVRETVERNMGEFEINSTLDKGTRVLLRFPKISSPAWIAEEIKIIKDDIVVILDDDPSVHGSWDAILAPILAKTPELEVKHFEEGKMAIDFINSLSARHKNKVCLLTDYELLNQDINGLEVIEQTKIKRSILVTSHYTNSGVRLQAMDLKVRILPKKLVYAVAMKLDKKIKPGSKKVDAVWVDDSRWFIDGLISRYMTDRKVDTYYEPHTFLEEVTQYPLGTKIILDHFYYSGDGLGAKFLGDGLEIARTLHKKGYTNLYMLTGEALDPSTIPDYLTVILKNEEEKIKNMITREFKNDK